MSISSDKALLANQLSTVSYPEDFKNFLQVYIQENEKIVDSVNSKEGALYLPQEVASFQRYFNRNEVSEIRNVYRVTIDIGSLPNTGAKRVSHGIDMNNEVNATRIYGCATNLESGEYLPLPYASATLANNIELMSNKNEIIITTAKDYSAFTVCTVVMEYTRN